MQSNACQPFCCKPDWLTACQHTENSNKCVSLFILQAVSVTFNELSLEHHASCRYDSVSLYDGSSANSSSLGRFCTGNMTTITSSGSSLFVSFQTDKGVSEGRFSLKWKFIGQCEAQGLFITNILKLSPGVSGQVVTVKYSWSQLEQYYLDDKMTFDLSISNEFHCLSLSLDGLLSLPVYMLYRTVVIIIVAEAPSTVRSRTTSQNQWEAKHIRLHRSTDCCDARRRRDMVW